MSDEEQANPSAQAEAAADVKSSLSMAQPVPLDPNDPSPSVLKSEDAMDVDEQANTKSGAGGGDTDDEDDIGPVTGRRRTARPAQGLLSDEEEDEDEGMVKPSASARAARSKLQTLMDDDDDDEEGGNNRTTNGADRADGDSAGASPEGERDQGGLDDLIPDDPSDGEGQDDDMFGDDGGLDGDDADDEERRARLNELEYRETDEPYDEVPREHQMARITLPNVPVRRTKAHWLARLPNFLDYRAQPFDANTFDPETDDNTGQGSAELSVKERLADPELRMLMKTKNTMRWRWSDKVDEDGVKFFDIPMNREGGGSSTNVGPAQANGILPPASQTAGASESQTSSTSKQSAQSSAFIVVPNREAQVLQAEMPLAGTMIFRPYNLQSETHRKLAKAVKYHKVSRVTASEDIPKQDPEVEKIAREKERRDEERKRQRQTLKSRQTLAGEEADEIDYQLRNQSRGGEGRIMRGGRGRGGGGEGGSGKGSRSGRLGRDEEEVYERDDFVVDDPDDDEDGSDEDEDENDEDGEGDDEDADGDEEDGPRRKRKEKKRRSDAMDVDEEPDEMELAERRIEENERAEKLAREQAAQRSDGKGAPTPRSKVLADSDDDEDSANKALGGAADEGEGAGSQVEDGSGDAGEKKRKRLIVDDDDDE
ncbi:Paf1 complex component [Tilletia horrida]|uniref:Paf1 complex component n=1 Tax=Tilletia horrida TaxID=155126 RepID=A0AAN6GTD7_9BASI|nr:Paf1 complex component [Tilletia horrida]